jgi:hypothetical protein
MQFEIIDDTDVHPMDGSRAIYAIPPGETTSSWFDRMKEIEINHPLFVPIDRKSKR